MLIENRDTRYPGPSLRVGRTGIRGSGARRGTPVTCEYIDGAESRLAASLLLPLLTEFRGLAPWLSLSRFRSARRASQLL